MEVISVLSKSIGGSRVMASEELRDEVRVLIRKVEQEDDPRLAVRLIRKRIAELNDVGEDVPEEFLLLQIRLVDECIYASQGR